MASSNLNENDEDNDENENDDDKNELQFVVKKIKYNYRLVILFLFFLFYLLLLHYYLFIWFIRKKNERKNRSIVLRFIQAKRRWNRDFFFLFSPWRQKSVELLFIYDVIQKWYGMTVLIFFKGQYVTTYLWERVIFFAART